MSTYLEIESYKELSLLKEIKQNHIQLMRSATRRSKLLNNESNVSQLALDSRPHNSEVLDPLLADLGIKIDNMDNDDQSQSSNGAVKAPKNNKKMKNNNNLDAINEEDSED